MLLIDYIELFGVVATIIAAVFVGRQTYIHFIRTKAFSYIERFNSEEFMNLRISIDIWLSQNSEDEINRVLRSSKKEDIEIAIKIRTFLNIFQELAVAFERNMIDKNIFYKNFDFLIISNWDKFEKFIYDFRIVSNDFTIYKRFELMVNDIKKYKENTNKNHKIYIFGYGSLILQESIHKTLKRDEANYEFHDAKLIGYKRLWNIIIPIFSEKLQKRINVLFLNIKKDKKSQTNGLILEINHDELSLLSKREINYKCIDVTKLVTTKHHLDKEDVVLTFIGEDEHLSTSNQENLYVMQNYLNILDQIKEQRPQFENSIKYNFNAKVLEGSYSFHQN